MPGPEFSSRRLLGAAVTALALALAAPAHAGPWESGVAAYERGEYAEALTHLRPLAEDGHLEAQRILGEFYRNGYGVEPDYKQAEHWFAEAGQQGDVVSTFELGTMYDSELAPAMGGFVSNDPDQTARYNAKALDFYKQAAERGFSTAQYFLGRLHEAGRGTARNREEARKWYAMAAERGVSEAAAALERLGE